MILKLENVMISLTNRCNLNCRMCDIPQIKNDYQELTTERVLKLIDEADELNADYFSISGGEPFLREDIIDILERINKSGLSAFISTNATGLRDEMIEKLGEINPHRINVSLEGPKKIHNNLRGGYKEVIKNMRKMKKEGINLAVSTVISSLNYEYINWVFEFCKTNKIDTFILQPFDPIFLNEEGDVYIPQGKEIDELEIELKKLKNSQSNVNIENLNIEKILTYFKDGCNIEVESCQMPSKSCVIDTDGQFYGCWPIYEISAGNVRKKSFRELWNSEEMRKVRKRASEGKCKGCLMGCYDKNGFNGNN